MSYCPLVSIMIPAYNQVELLEKAIDSALSQSYKNIEIIVCDDSTNDFSQIMVKNRYQSSKIKYFKNSENIGRVKNYRKCLFEHAKGDWVVNLDGDDSFVDDDFIYNALDLIKKNKDLAFVFGRQMKFFLKDNSKSVLSSKMKLSKVIDGNWLFLNAQKLLIEIPHLATLYNREKAIKLDFYGKDILSSDRESLFKLMINNKVGFIDSIVGKWNQHGNNASSSSDIKYYIDNLTLYTSLYKHARQNSNISFFKLFLWKINSLCNSIKWLRYLNFKIFFRSTIHLVYKYPITLFCILRYIKEGLLAIYNAKKKYT